MSVKFECPKCKEYAVVFITRHVGGQFNCPYCKVGLVEDKEDEKDKRNNSTSQPDEQTK